MNIIKNTLIINGKATERNEIRRYIRIGPNGKPIFDFNLILPVQDVLHTTQVRERWGTYWYGSDLVAEEHKAKLILNFDTFDSPPLPIVKHLIGANPHLYYIFYYEGPTFKGMIKARHGKVLKETYKEW